MKLTDENGGEYSRGDRVEYGDEAGTVSSVSDEYVFVKFDDQVMRLGFEGATAQACKPSHLKLLRKSTRNDLA